MADQTRPEQSGASAFLIAFDAFAQAVRRARGAPAQGPEETLTLSQYALLQGLSERGRARVVELASAAGVTPPTATRILDALERRGIVERRRVPEDRRGVTITLTPGGRELLAAQHGGCARARSRSTTRCRPASATSPRTCC